MRLLGVEDEVKTGDYLRQGLTEAGFMVELARNGLDGHHLAMTESFELIVLDVMLPDVDGWRIVQSLREAGRQTPVLFLTARDSVEDKVTGLTLGADDYVTKPFSLEEVVARLRVILRRSGRTEETAPSRISFADIELDDDTHEVWKAGEAVSLSPTEFTLLRYFMVNAGTVLSKPRILDHVWHYDFGGEVGVVESYVSYLRRKIDTGDTRLIHTLRGVGYVMRQPR